MGNVREINILFGVIIPSAIFIISFILTYLLYLHFSKKVLKKE